MANVQIPNLPAVTGLDGNELFEGVQSGSSVKIGLGQIIAAVRTGTPTALPLPVPDGGTGLSSYKVGDIVYASATETLAPLPDVATGNVLLSGGVGSVPSYGKVGLATHVSGTLPVTSGGTNIVSYTVGDLVYASATDTLSKLPDVATGNVLLSGGVGASPSYGKVTLTGHVSDVLPVANGGTNIATYTTGDITYASAPGVLSKLPDVATGNALISGGVGVAPSYGKIGLTTHISGVLPVANGGTNIATYAVGDLIYASTTGVLSKLADVATGNALISGGVGVAPSYGKIGLTTHVSGTLPVANGGTGVTTAPAEAARIMGYTSTATAAGTTVLTSSSSQYQLFTGVTTQTITLPVTSTLTTGWSFHVVNNSTGNLTVNSSGGNLVCTIIPGVSAMVTCIGTTLTTAADWEPGFTDFSSVTGTGSAVLSDGPTINNGAFNGTVGATTPSTGAFTTATVGLGAVATPSLVFTGDTNTGMWSPGADLMAFSLGGTERVRLDAGYMRMAAASGGIQFNGDTLAANALNDYEEGTWTPVVIGSTLAGTGTYTSQIGTYVKVGKLVFISCTIVWTAHTGTGNMLVTGIPFTAASTKVSGLIISSSLTIPASSFAMIEIQGSQILILSQVVGASGAAQLAMDTAATIGFSAVYSV